MSGIQGTTADAYNKESTLQQASGGKGGGTTVDAMGRPMVTAMNTPIVYGKTYLDGYTKDYIAPLAVNSGSITSAGDSGGNGGNSGDSVGIGSNSTTSSADNSGNTVGEGIGAPSSPGEGSADGSAYANGTMSVPGYYNGSMGVDDDPWAWVNKQQIAAPLGAEIKPSNEQAMGRMPDKLEQQLSSMALGKGVDAATKGIDTAYKAYNTAAPLAAAAETGATAATAGASGAAMAGGEAALAALGPVGMAIGAGLLAKKLGIF